MLESSDALTRDNTPEQSTPVPAPRHTILTHQPHTPHLQLVTSHGLHHLVLIVSPQSVDQHIGVQSPRHHSIILQVHTQSVATVAGQHVGQLAGQSAHCVLGQLVDSDLGAHGDEYPPLHNPDLVDHAGALRQSLHHLTSLQIIHLNTSITGASHQNIILYIQSGDTASTLGHLHSMIIL